MACLLTQGPIVDTLLDLDGLVFQGEHQLGAAERDALVELVDAFKARVAAEFCRANNKEHTPAPAGAAVGGAQTPSGSGSDNGSNNGSPPGGAMTILELVGRMQQLAAQFQSGLMVLASECQGLQMAAPQ